jgi:hypothetical protein
LPPPFIDVLSSTAMMKRCDPAVDVQLIEQVFDVPGVQATRVPLVALSIQSVAYVVSAET